MSSSSSNDNISNEEQQQQTTSNTNASSKKSESVANLPKDKHSVSKRLQQELLSLMMSGEKGVSAFPDGDNLFKWIGTIQGPAGTVKFKLLNLSLFKTEKKFNGFFNKKKGL